MLRLHFAIASVVAVGAASSVLALPFHVPGSEAEASIGSSYFGRLPDSDWEFNCGGRGQTFNGSGVQFNSIRSDSHPDDEKKWKTYHMGDGKHITYTDNLSISTNSQGGRQFTSTTGDVNIFN
ncbi:uncharacterized protein C8R40DRAFT_1176012 [Lentinula edodes]|uniref:uncharacterized protein n=1 Tax=Lentinula edodes TaxID=5353 RepID=UPI001E8CA814|nr:uncharacterized protein C8R40DRAFT_1176012 [Lentinula edodes]KAH7870101.1 hypothetical protein C8R40DRAFT_1176012 [Lentinula edodes]